MKMKKILSELKPFFETFQLNLDDNTQIDYFITFKNEGEIPLEILNQMGQWRHYGEKKSSGMVLFIEREDSIVSDGESAFRRK